MKLLKVFIHYLLCLRGRIMLHKNCNGTHQSGKCWNLNVDASFAPTACFFCLMDCKMNKKATNKFLFYFRSIYKLVIEMIDCVFQQRSHQLSSFAECYQCHILLIKVVSYSTLWNIYNLVVENQWIKCLIHTYYQIQHDIPQIFSINWKKGVEERVGDFISKNLF